MGTLNDHNNAKRANAQLGAAQQPYPSRHSVTVKLRINTYSCQYYVNGNGEEATFVPTTELGRWITDVTVPYTEEQTSRTLHEWLTGDIVWKYGPNEKQTCMQADYRMEFVSSVKVSPHFNIKLVQLEDYKNMTVGMLLNDETTPFKLFSGIINKTYTAYVIIYREQIAPPTTRPRAKPLSSSSIPSTPTGKGLLLSSPVSSTPAKRKLLSSSSISSTPAKKRHLLSSPISSTQLKGRTFRDKELDDDPFLDQCEHGHVLPGQPMCPKSTKTPRRPVQHNATQSTTPATNATTSPKRILIDLTSDTSDEDEFPDIMTVAQRERWFSPSRKLKRIEQNNSPGPTKKGQQSVFIKEESSSPSNTNPVATGRQPTVSPEVEELDLTAEDTVIRPLVKLNPRAPESLDTEEGLVNNTLLLINTAEVPTATSQAANSSRFSVSSSLSSLSSSPSSMSSTVNHSPSSGRPTRKRKAAQSTTNATHPGNAGGPITRRRAQTFGTTDGTTPEESHGKPRRKPEDSEVSNFEETL
ncbi:hypothetical protein F4781DRAFT_434339 [Annulohypoxylon bovei var. microspora]|nr:hypothetical protein F4781DRAFT_434339 [Annulohypoxylon bovei var. microspora]